LKSIVFVLVVAVSGNGQWQIGSQPQKNFSLSTLELRIYFNYMQCLILRQTCGSFETGESIALGVNQKFNFLYINVSF
jgi:hypothetical protein